MSRIIAGSLGGRRITAPDGRSTRPTSDRTREALFASLDATHELSAGPFLDLYAGSGAVAFEAISRGAPSAVLVESAKPAVAVIERNARELKIGAQVRVISSTVERALPHLGGLGAMTVFVDPPYADSSEALAALLGQAVEVGVLANDALVVVERDRRSDWSWPLSIEAVRERRYGETTLWYGRPL